MSQMGPYLHSPTDFFVTFYRDAKLTGQSRVITIDIFLFGLAGVILMVIEARKAQREVRLAYIVGGILVAISVTFPLFLIARELRMRTSDESRLPATDTVLLVLAAVAVTGLTTWLPRPTRRTISSVEPSRPQLLSQGRPHPP
jgi:uncharacterized membrane protein